MTTGTKKKIRVGQRLRRGVYLLPSLFTAGNITLGFLAIISALPGDTQNFSRAALMVFFAGILDGLDGRIARFTGTESEFGKELDSLADVLTFGAAPALLAYLWALRPLDRLGWILPLFFLFCTAVRLARFNVQTKTTSSRYFVGLPSPPAAGAIVGLMLISYQPNAIAMGLKQEWLKAAMPFALVLVGTLMVTTFRYPSLKMAKLDKRMSYRGYVPTAIFFVILMLYPETLFPLVAFLYLIYGPLAWCFARLRRRGLEYSKQPAPSD